MSIVRFKDKDGNWLPIPVIKGDKGDKGDSGRGIVSAEINDFNELVITFSDGTSEILGEVKGDSGFTPYIYNDKWYINGTDTGVKAQGDDGDTPIKGVDYWTETDKAELINSIKSSLSLGIASDGLVYLFVDGNPVGTGIPQGQTAADVYGYIDENNTVILAGNLTDGTYSIKYEMDNGSTIDIGDLVLDTPEEEPEVPTPTNALPLAVNKDGSEYVGDNGEDGYNIGKKISVSSDAEASDSACVSGYIKLAEGVHSIIRIKNISVSDSASINNLMFYDANKTKIKGYAGLAGSFNEDVAVDNGVYIIETKNWFTDSNIPVFFRFSCGEITADTIVTINEEIV